MAVQGQIVAEEENAKRRHDRAIIQEFLDWCRVSRQIEPFHLDIAGRENPMEAYEVDRLLDDFMEQR